MKTVRRTFSWHFSTRMRAGNNGLWFYAESLSRWCKQTPSLVPFTDRDLSSTKNVSVWTKAHIHAISERVTVCHCTQGWAACGASSMRPAGPLSRAFKAALPKPEHCLSTRTLKLAAWKDFDPVSVSAAFLLNAENAGFWTTGWTLETSCRLTAGHSPRVRIIQHIKGIMSTT